MASSISDNAPRALGTLGTLVVITLLGAPVAPASADPLRLRADAYAFGNGVGGGAGLLSLQGRDKFTPWLDAEAQIWLGAGDGSYVYPLDEADLASAYLGAIDAISRTAPGFQPLFIVGDEAQREHNLSKAATTIGWRPQSDRLLE